MKKKDPESTEMTFFEHIDALRPHLVRGVMAIGVIGLVAFFCKSFIIDTVLFGPQSPDFPTNRMLTWVGAQWAQQQQQQRRSDSIRDVLALYRMFQVDYTSRYQSCRILGVLPAPRRYRTSAKSRNTSGFH